MLEEVSDWRRTHSTFFYDYDYRQTIWADGSNDEINPYLRSEEAILFNIQYERREQRRPRKEEQDDNLVTWVGNFDPENPMYWSYGRRLLMTMLASLMTTCVTFASSVFSAATVVTAEQFEVSEEVMILGVTLYVLGFAVGPLIFGPISEIYGRSRPLLIGYLCFILCNVPVGAANDVGTLLTFRFFTAVCGSAPIAITPGILVDIWEPYPRGVATLVWAMTVFAGPVIGPVIGEFTVKNPNLGWRWTLWFTIIMSMTIWIISLFVLEETAAPIILQRKAARLRRETKNWALHSKLDEQPIEYGQLVRKYGIKPLQMLAKEPILMVITIFLSIVYAIVYLTFFAFPYSFGVVRGWEAGISSLPFLSVFVGFMIGFLFSFLDSRLRFMVLLRRHNGRVAPEERLPPMIVGSAVLIGGLFWFAWTSDKDMTWVPQVISCAFIGCGIFMIFIPAVVYLMDIYLANAASALSGNGFVRAMTACVFPLFGGQMYSNLGVAWATSVLGFMVLALAPFPILFYIYGKKIRSWSTYVMNNA